MKTIPELLSGQFDEELRVIVAEERGWKLIDDEEGYIAWKRGACREVQAMHGIFLDKDGDDILPPFSSSLDACRELLSDIKGSLEEAKFDWTLDQIQLESEPVQYRWRATARQICVAWLISKGVLK